ncbi:MAG: hypothetical protein D6719_10525 [Candidatus Dadabacteria bacterium]|nr:MAG: hypothetical protein D6719_10525 [Candidatus Dadabacteria bacterium]
MVKALNNPLIKKLLIIGGILAAVQVGILYYFKGKSKPLSIRESINLAVDKKQGIDSRRKLQLKIQLAVTDYRQKHHGQLPASLQELVPLYFDSVPIDPDTGKPFSYRVKNQIAYVGETEEERTKVAKKGKGGKFETTHADLSSEMESPEVQSALIATLSEEPKEKYIYDPTGKRDPFMPFDFSSTENLKGKTPLERYQLGQLKLTAVLDGFEEPAAIVENQEGRGFTVRKGTKIGPNGGVIVDIKKDRLIIVEQTRDFTGKVHNRTVEMRLRLEEEELH